MSQTPRDLLQEVSKTHTHTMEAFEKGDLPGFMRQSALTGLLARAAIRAGLDDMDLDTELGFAQYERLSSEFFHEMELFCLRCGISRDEISTSIFQPQLDGHEQEQPELAEQPVDQSEVTE